VRQTVSGVTIGVVQDVDDPEQLGRIKMEFPALGLTSDWSRVAVAMAGNGRGMQFMPEVGDEVLVAFDQGDVTKAYVLGYLWNGVDAPPQTDANKRTIHTVSGHLMEFDDTSGSEKITLKFKGGDPSITIEQNKLSITFDGSTSIELSSSGVKVKGTMIELN
jgi:phage baseplate assembly protein V